MDHCGKTRRHTQAARRGFTLVELLAVIATLSILSGLLVPTVLAARRAGERTRARLLFQSWAAAIESYRAEYGRYPVLGADGKVNAGATEDLSAEHRFHDVLAGRRRDGSVLPVLTAQTNPEAPQAQNPRGIRFIRFPEDAFRDDAFDRSGLLHDAFGGGDIAVVVDLNDDGRIDRLDYESLPAVKPVDDPSRTIAPDWLEAGLRVGVAIYSAPPGARDADELLQSW